MNTRNIKYIVIHCTATIPEAKLSAIQNYWKSVLNWKNPGYHYLIEADGKKNQLADEDQVTNGVAGYNKESIHISYIGGIDESGKAVDTRTALQIETMKQLVTKMKAKYPQAVIQGHRDFPNVKKACPAFDVKAWLTKDGL